MGNDMRRRRAAPSGTHRIPESSHGLTNPRALVGGESESESTWLLSSKDEEDAPWRPYTGCASAIG